MADRKTVQGEQVPPNISPGQPISRFPIPETIGKTVNGVLTTFPHKPILIYFSPVFQTVRIGLLNGLPEHHEYYAIPMELDHLAGLANEELSVALRPLMPVDPPILKFPT